MNYCGAAGAAMITLDIEHANMAIFELAIISDFKEAECIKEGLDPTPIQEASIKSIFDSIFKSFDKLINKIDDIFSGFIAKFENYIDKDIKPFVDKYRDKINKKSNFNGMKAWFQEPLNNTGGFHPYVYGEEYFVAIASHTKIDYVMDLMKNGKPMPVVGIVDDFADRFLSNVLGKQTNAKSFQYDLHTVMYGKLEKKNNWTKKDISKIMDRLYSSDDVIKDLKEINASLKKQINDAADRIFNDRKTILDNLKKDDNDGSISMKPMHIISKEKKDPRSKYITTNVPTDKMTIKDKTEFRVVSNVAQNMLLLMQNESYAHQKAISVFCKAVMAEAKWGLVQDRRIFAQAVGYSPKNESALLAEAMGDVAQWECESYFEDAEVLGVM